MLDVLRDEPGWVDDVDVLQFRFETSPN